MEDQVTENPVNPETSTIEPQTIPELKLSFADKICISVDRPMGAGTFALKNIVQGTSTALITVGVFKVVDFLKARKERKAELANPRYAVAGE